MRYFLLLSGVSVVLFGFSNVHAENLSYMISGQEKWDIERLAKDIERTEDRIALDQLRLAAMKKEMAEKVAAIESAAGQQDQARDYDHYLGHH